MEKKYEDKKKEIIHHADNVKRKTIQLVKKIKHNNKHYRRQAVDALNRLAYETIPKMIVLQDMIENIEKCMDDEIEGKGRR